MKVTGVVPTVVLRGVGPLTSVAKTPFVPETDKGLGKTLVVVVGAVRVIVIVTMSLATVVVGVTLSVVVPVCES